LRFVTFPNSFVKFVLDSEGGCRIKLVATHMYPQYFKDYSGEDYCIVPML